MEPKSTSHQMSELELQIQKHVISFCKILPIHVEHWKQNVQKSRGPVTALTNLGEQTRHIKKTKLDFMEDFEDAQKNLLYQISQLAEEDIITLKETINELNKCNHDLKNKLYALERSTMDFSWDEKSMLVKGSGSQPPLSRLLQDGLNFLDFFLRMAKNINEAFKLLNLDDEKSLKLLADSFQINFDDAIVRDFVAVCQYVDDNKNIV